MDIKVDTEAENTTKTVPIVHLGGEIDLHTCPELRTALQKIVETGQSHIILDMAEVPYVDSAALGVLVDTQRRLKEKSGTLHLAALSPFVSRALEITRLIRIFRVHDSVDEAVQNAGPA